MSTNAITHVEWDSADHTGLKDFLSGVFGWQFEPFGETYFHHNPGKAGVSVGVNKNEKAIIGNGTPNVYIDVQSIDDTFSKAAALGGGVAVPKTPIQGMGSYAFIKAPDGNLIGLFESK